MFKFKKPQRDVYTVFCHHTASSAPGHDSLNWFYDIHVKENGWSGIGYHYIINYSGQVLPARNLESIPIAQKGHNTGSIAICIAGTGDSFTKEQLEAFKRLAEDINRAYNGEIVFKGHKEVNNTECPHYDYKKLLDLNELGYMPQPQNFVARFIESIQNFFA